MHLFDFMLSLDEWANLLSGGETQLDCESSWSRIVEVGWRSHQSRDFWFKHNILADERCRYCFRAVQLRARDELRSGME